MLGRKMSHNRRHPGAAAIFVTLACFIVRVGGSQRHPGNRPDQGARPAQPAPAPSRERAAPAPERGHERPNPPAPSRGRRSTLAS